MAGRRKPCSCRVRSLGKDVGLAFPPAVRTIARCLARKSKRHRHLCHLLRASAPTGDAPGGGGSGCSFPSCNPGTAFCEIKLVLSFCELLLCPRRSTEYEGELRKKPQDSLRRAQRMVREPFSALTQEHWGFNTGAPRALTQGALGL